MIGTASIDYEMLSRGVYSGKSVRKITYTIASSASGEVESNPSSPILGRLERVTIHPNKVAKPTDAWDVYLYDISASRDLNYGSVDLLASAGENVTNTHSVQLVLSNPPLVAGEICLSAKNMGNAKKAQVIVYIE